jgi:transcriptional regulator with XRE-family HTH domain
MNNIRLIRQRKDITQMQLAARSGISQHSISKLETGRTRPKRETLEKLASGLDIDNPDVLITEDVGHDGGATFEQILEASPDQRLSYFELARELDHLEKFEESLRRHYAQNRARFKDYPEHIESKLEAAVMLGYAMGLREARQDTDGADET